ncbi:MAG TPA: tetratricopeptide repeat protein [Candidatus Acidoferrum sp.]|nr:tetratricopeptide repeat protein [Candidatus Acidoferrum sp.]
MSEKKSKVKFSLSKKKTASIIATAVVLLLACGAGVLVSWLQHNAGKGNTAQNNNGSGGNVSGLPTTPVLTSVAEAQKFEDQGNYDAAQRSISQSLTSASSSNEKYQLYLEQGVTYENQQQYDNAIAAYNNAKLIEETPAVYEAIARVAGILGNKQLEIDSLNKAIAVMDMTKSRSAGDKQQLEDQIRGLGQ